MKISPHFSRRARGTSLVESVIAVGVLSVAIPLVMGTIAESGKSGSSAEAETRSTWIVPACVREIQASRDGKPEFFTPTSVGESLPTGGGPWALAFSDDGKPVGTVAQESYDKGLTEVEGKAVRYIASISSKPVETDAETEAGGETGEVANPPLQEVLISLEYPAASPAVKRHKLDFLTRVP